MKRLLAPPVFEDDEDKTRIAGLLHTILLAAMAATVMLIIATPIVSADPVASWIFEGILVLLELSALILMRHGHVQLASALFTSGAWAYVTLVIFAFGGVRGPNTVSYISVVLIAGFLGGQRAGVIFAGLSALAGLGMFYAEMGGGLPPPVVPLAPVGWWITLTANLIMATALPHVATRSIHEALERARREIAERKQAEEALRESEARYRTLHEQVQHHAEQLEQHVAERTRELADVVKRLTQLDRLKSKFVSDVSHELRTPATNISLYVSLLESGKPEKRDGYLRVLTDQTERLKSLIEGILKLSELDLEKDKATFAPVSLNAVVAPIIASHRPRAEAAGLQLTFDPGTDLPAVNGNIDQLAQVATHLIVNALNYTPAGQVRVSTYRKHQAVCLQVQDTGIGIDSEDMPHLFERFYRGKGVAQSTIPGTGLGLAIVKQIVDLAGGSVEVESEVGVGSVFKVWLPLADKAD